MSYYAKAIVMVVATVVSALIAALVDGHVDSVEWLSIVMAGLAACSVFAAPNVPGAIYTKCVLAGLIAAGDIALNFIVPGTGFSGITLSQWLQMLVAVLGALGVYAVPNHVAGVVSPTIPKT